LKSFRFSGRTTAVCAVILAVAIPATAQGYGEGKNLLLGKRNPSSNAALGLTSETEIIANNSTYGTRQSNKGTGGGAIYGCRTAPGQPPCVRANNLSTGHAFEFVNTSTTAGPAGLIQVGNPAQPPFTTNATGLVTNFNADKLDGKDSTDFASATDLKTLQNQLLDAQVGADGTLSPNSRGATKVVEATTGTAPDTDVNYTVTFNGDVSKCSYTASPVGSASSVAPGVAAKSGDAASVVVDMGPKAGSFHLQVIC
jgi:hypothetical protein